MAAPKRILVVWLWVALPLAALAGPQGESVQRGNVTIHRDGSVTAIDASDGAIIHFDSFDILRHETVRFQQPSESARVLNRVLGADPTRIDGSLLANGRVYILNSAGVFVGGEAVIDVGGLVAAAGQLSNEDFVAGIDRLTQLTGDVVNRGAIRANTVALIGRTVANFGSIVSPGGMIVLAAGDDVFLTHRDGRVVIQVDSAVKELEALDALAIDQAGLLDAGRGGVNLTAGDAYALAINHSGITRGHDIVMDGGAQGRVEVAGLVDASDASPGGRGGSIRVLGDEVAVRDARIDASGDAGGGEVLIGGGFQGGGGVRSASRTLVSRDADIRADALRSGDGGEVIVWADGVTGFAGRISARGGAEGGDGGFAEVSGKDQLIYRGTTDLSAAQGATGTLLLDPTTLTIENGDGTGAEGSLDDLLDESGRILAEDGGAIAATISENALETQSQDSVIVLQANEDIVMEDLQDDELGLTNSIQFLADADGDNTGGFWAEDTADTIRTEGGDVVVLAGVIVDERAPDATAIVIGSIDTSGSVGKTVVEEGEDPSPGGGRAGLIALDATRGDILVRGDLTAVGGEGVTPEAEGVLAGNGGSGGPVTVLTRQGSVDIQGSITSSGGDGPGNGGSAGRIQITSALVPAVTGPEPEDDAAAMPGNVTVAGDLTALGGSSTGSKPTDPDEIPEGATYNGGNGGAVAIEAAGGSLEIDGSIVTSGGAGDEAGGDAADIRLAASEIPAVPDPSEGGEGTPAVPGNVELNASRVSAVGGAGGEADGTAASLVVVAEGAVSLEFDSLDVEQLGVTQRDVGSDTVVEVAGSRVLDILGEATADEVFGKNVVSRLDTETAANGLQLLFALEDAGTSIEIDPGAVRLSGGSAELRAPGDILVGDGSTTVVTATDGASLTLRADQDGDGSGAVVTPGLLDAADVHINSVGGDVTLEGTTVGVLTDGAGEEDPPQVTGPVRIRAAGGGLTLAVEGDAQADVTGPGFGAISVSQRNAEGNVDIDQVATVIDIDGDAGGDESPRRSILTRVDMAEGVGFVYALSDGEAELVVPSGLSLGGDTILSGGGDLRLDGGAGAPIEAHGHDLALEADSNRSGAGAILQSGSDVSIVMGGTADSPAQLLLLAGSGVGSPDDPAEPAAEAGALRTRGAIELAGRTETGGFHVEHTGELTLADVAIAHPTLGDSASTGSHGIAVLREGDVRLRNLGTEAPIRFDGDGSLVLVDSAGSQNYEGAGAVLLEADTVLRAGGDVLTARVGSDGLTAMTVDSAGSADSPEDERFGLTVLAAGTTTLGTVGATNPLAGLTTDAPGTTRLLGGGVTTRGGQQFGDAVTVEGDTDGVFRFSATTVEVPNGEGEPVERLGSIEFGSTLDGEVELEVEASARVAFLGNVGTRRRPTSLDVDILEEDGGIEFAANQVRVGEGGIRLNADGRTLVPERATVVRRGGGIRFDTPGEFVMGVREKLSVDGALGIRADSAALGDLSAASILVDADTITLRAREPGDVLLPDGRTVRDDGLDIVADQIRFTSRPVVDDSAVPGAAPTPIFVTQNGDLSMPGNIRGFELRLFDDAGGSAASALSGGDGLDLVGRGPRAVVGAATEVVHPRHAALPPRRVAVASSVNPTWLVADVEPEEVYAFLRCFGAGAGSGCLPPVGAGPAARESIGVGPIGSSLSTLRALDAAQAYRALRDDYTFRDAGLADLREAIQEVRRPDGTATAEDLWRLLDTVSAHRETYQYLRAVEEVVVLLRLMDLSDAAWPELRAAVIADLFGTAEPIEGIEPEALLRDPVQALVEQVATP